MKIEMTKESNKVNMTESRLWQIFVVSVCLTMLFVWNTITLKFLISTTSLKGNVSYRIKLDVTG